MKKLISALFALLVCSQLFGASHLEKALKEASLDQTMIERAEQFRKATHANDKLFSSVYVYSGRTIKDYTDRPEILAARLALLGFDGVYLCCPNSISNPSKPRHPWVVRFNKAAHSYGMKVYAVTLSDHKTLYSQNPNTKSLVDDIQKFNDTYGPEVAFDGISADLEPHILKAGRKVCPDDLKWSWDSKNNLGVGRDNDMLLKMTLDILAESRKHMHKDLVLSEAVAQAFQTLYNEGEVAHGSAKQFLKSCNWLIVMAYNYKPETVIRWALPYLKNAKEKPSSISIAIKTSLNGVGPETTSFMPEGWDKMIEGIDQIIKEASAYPSFRGLDIFEFQGFERMWDGSEPTEEHRRKTK